MKRARDMNLSRSQLTAYVLAGIEIALIALGILSWAVSEYHRIFDEADALAHWPLGVGIICFVIGFFVGAVMMDAANEAQHKKEQRQTQ